MSEADSINPYHWLVSDIKEADMDRIEAAIEEMGRYEVVVQSTLRKVFLYRIVPIKVNPKLVV